MKKKVIDIEERIPSMRERRKRRANRKFIFIVTIFFIALLSVLYFQSSLSKVDQIKVSGANIHSEQFYIEQSGLESNKSFIFFSKKDMVKALAAIDEVKEVTVERKWLRDVNIHVTEWRAIAYIEPTYHLLLENGNIFEQTELGITENAPILTGFTSEESQKKIAKQLLEMEGNGDQLISEIIYTGTEERPDYITVFTDDGYEIRAIIPTFAEKMMYYSEIVAQLTEEEKGIIDMEVGTYFTPYSKFYNTETISEDEDEEEGHE